GPPSAGARPRPGGPTRAPPRRDRARRGPRAPRPHRHRRREGRRRAGRRRLPPRLQHRRERRTDRLPRARARPRGRDARRRRTVTDPLSPAPGRAPEVRERKLAIPDHLSPFQVLGENDQALAALEDAVPDTDVHVRGHQVTLRGTDDALRRGEHIMRSLIELAGTGQPVTAEAVQRAANLFGDDRASGRKLEEVLSRTILSSRGRTIRPKTMGQKSYIEAIESSTITFGIGPAGTGKTYLAVAMAVQKLLSKQINRIILTRPAVEAGERLGFLPGSLNEKIDPYLRPLYDALHDMLDPDSIPRLMGAGTIEVAPLAYMRGRTLNDAFIILDEAQNTTP